MLHATCVSQLVFSSTERSRPLGCLENSPAPLLTQNGAPNRSPWSLRRHSRYGCARLCESGLVSALSRFSLDGARLVSALLRFSLDGTRLVSARRASRLTERGSSQPKARQTLRRAPNRQAQCVRTLRRAPDRQAQCVRTLRRAPDRQACASLPCEKRDRRILRPRLTGKR